jgi:predicted DNA-binding transcriptional regulator YafY
LGAATVPLLSGDGPTVPPEVLTVVATAIANHERLRFAYQDGNGAESKRLAEPHSLVSASRRWYLVAFDNDRDDWRIFRLDRVQALLATGARFAVRELPAADPAAYVTSKLYSVVPTYQAVATLHAPREEVFRRFGNSAGELTALNDKTCQLRSHTDTLEWLAFRLTMIGCEFEVHEPPELAEYLRAFGARAVRAGKVSYPGRAADDVGVSGAG